MKSRAGFAEARAGGTRCAGAVLALSLAVVSHGTDARASASPFVDQYRTIERAYRENRWALLNGIVTRDFRYVEVDGTPKTVAGLGRDATAFAKQGGRVRSARVRVVSLRGKGTTRTATVTASLDVSVGRPGSTVRIVQVDVDRDTWRRSAGRWLLSRTEVTSEAVTRFGNPSSARVGVRSPHERPPDLGHQYAIIDRAFRESRWDLVRPFSTRDTHFIEVDGSTKTLDELSAGGKAFASSGGIATSTHMLPVHVVRVGDSVTVAVLATAAGSYLSGTHRVRFAQQVAQQDTWKRVESRWLYAGGRILRQTITTFAAKPT